MATFKQTLKHSMMRYNSIHLNPVDVLIHLFCIIGNGFEWKNGQLVDRCGSSKDIKNPKMKHYEQKIDKFLNGKSKALVALRKERELEAKARRIQENFVKRNIDTIVEANPTAVYFGREPRGYYFLKGICVQYARAFSFPNNIKKDWAQALYKFLNYWLEQLNCEYGVGYKVHDISFWPKDIQEARQAILDVRTRLHPIVHNGQTYEQYIIKMKELFKGILDPENSPESNIGTTKPL